MKAKPTIFSRAVGFVVPVAIGIGALALFIRGRQAPERRPLDEEGRAVRVMEVPTVTAIPSAVGYGVAQSKREWDMVAEVSGRVIELHEDLETGRVLKQGTKLIKIDPSDYKLTAAQQKATVNNAKAQLSELASKEKNTKASLKIAKRTLELANKEYAQTQTLFAGGNATANDVDNAERQVLSAKSSVQSFQSTLAELPAKRRGLRAQVDQLAAGLSGAQLDLTRTELEAPFDIRVRSVNVELRELVTAGTVLAIGDGIDVAEVPAQFSIGALAPLVRSARPDAPPAGEAPTAGAIGERLRLGTSLGAKVRLESGQLVAEWDATLDRFANVDSQTRTVSVVVAVESPFGGARPGRQPPLVAGMYVEVELRGQPIEGCRAIPRSALHDKKIYVAGPDNRLQVRDAEVTLLEGEFACVGVGVEPGETIVLTDIVPAIEGMLLDPRLDENAKTTLIATIEGEDAAQ